MDSKTIFSKIFLLFFYVSIVQAQPIVFDITKYGAVADGKADTSQAILSAWKEACAATGSSKILIPAGTFLSGVVSVAGPCKGGIEIEVQGTLQAPPDLQGEGWFNFDHVDEFTISGKGTFDGQGESAWKANNCAKDPKCKPMPMNFRFNFIKKGLVRDVTSLNSKNFHVNVLGCEDFTFQSFIITAPETSINTDGIHIGRSKGVNIIDTKIGTGDDCISIGDGTQNLKVSKVTCGPGHGISIGSLGRYENEEPVSGITVTGCTLTNTMNGVRIKSWPAQFGGSASDIHFEDITMENVSNPILIDQNYCPYGQCNDKGPSKVKISGVSIKNIKGTSASALSVKLDCSSGFPCENVELADIDLAYSGAEGPAKSECTNVKPTITGKLNPAGCQ
ncbi:exopolygalacturonase-like [Hevea brasiliensis]|uniref:exopolygalacturonase-like n=1 Tax=Hevea brasiliensis TaxID=3981 RepID=UPI0025D5F200|nr:exopolygalacturonase-like [Hevea brasiliensis]